MSQENIVINGFYADSIKVFCQVFLIMGGIMFLLIAYHASRPEVAKARSYSVFGKLLAEPGMWGPS